MYTICYITTKTREEAKIIIKKLLEERLIACANIFPIESFFEWKGEFCEESEYAIIAKTVREHFEKIEKTVKHLHSYEIPCIVRFDMEEGNNDFLSWIAETVQNKK